MKIRTDFVTNSSSSSFTLVIGFKLVDGSTVYYTGEGGVPEGPSEQFIGDAIVSISPKQLGNAGSVEELISLLADNVYDDADGTRIFKGSNPERDECIFLESGLSVMRELSNEEEFELYDPREFIDEIRDSISSMDQIKRIVIGGYESNYENHNRVYTYDLETGEYTGREEGRLIEVQGGHGGDLILNDLHQCKIQRLKQGTSSWYDWDEEEGEGEEYEDEDEDEEEEEDSYNSDAARAERFDEWMSKYASYVETNPHIDFNGTLFVFSGLISHQAEKEHPIVQKVIEKGGQYRSKISGLTNYLVVDPRDAGTGKIEAAVKQQENGKDLKIVLLSDLEAALEGKTASGTIQIPQTAATPPSSGSKKATETTTKTASSSPSEPINIPTSDLNKVTKTIVIENGKLIRYTGNAGTPDIPEGVTVIATGAFDGLENMICTDLPVTVRHIEKGAFRNCPNLFRVAILETLQSIDEGAFQNNGDNFYIDTTEGSYAAKYGKENGINIKTDGLFTKNEKMIKKAKAAREIMQQSAPEKTAKFSAESASSGNQKTTKTAREAENNGRSFRKLTAADNCQIDNSGTLINCSEGGAIELPDGIKKIGGCCCDENKSLTAVKIPEGVEEIEDFAFTECKNLEFVSLPSTLKKIGEGAFQECAKLKQVDIPEGVEEIGDWAFDKCTNLEHISLPSTLRTIGWNLLGDCDRAFISAPAGSVASQYAQENNIPLSSSKGASSSTTFGSAQSSGSAQHKNSGDNSRSFRKLTVADNCVVGASGTLRKCNAGGFIELPDGIKKIGERCFYFSEKLIAVKIPEGVEEIEERAFDGCSKLEFVSLPSTLKKIGECAFGFCEALKQVDIPEGVEKIDAFAFLECKNLEFVSFPSTLREIGWTIFKESDHLSVYAPVGSIARQYALQYGIPLSSSKGVSSSTSTSSTTFGSARSSGSAQHKNSRDNGQGFRKLTATDNCQIDNSGTLINCSEGGAIELPDGIKKIGECCCNDNEALAAIKIPEGVEEIKGFAFSKCKNLEFISLPSTLKKIGNGAFDMCIKLKQVDIPEGVEEIGDWAFDECTNLEHISLPSTLRTIGWNLLGDCNRVSISAPAGSVASQYALENNIPLSSSKGASASTAYQSTATSSQTYTSTYNSTSSQAYKSPLSSSSTYTPSSLKDTSSAPAPTSDSNGGCYVATCVYGSYDCPEVWTLRRYRDNTLAETWYGRAFIRTYYAISPTIVKWFGHTDGFKKLWKGKLDRMVAALQENGVESTPYADIDWRKHRS